MSRVEVDRPTVELWWSSIGDGPPPQAELTPLLDDEERRRALRFRVAEAGRRFVVAHAMLRRLLGERLGVPAPALRLTAGPRGKPFLVAPEPAPHFNLSHSGEVAVVAIAAAEVGVDVEALRPVPRAERLAARFFAESERLRLRELSGERLARSFLAHWTCKEAYLKAIGTGIGVPLSRVEVDPRQPAMVAAPGDPHAHSGWTLLPAELPLDALCTVAVRGTGWGLEVRRFEWRSEGVEG